jgi:DNA (cytosine-5)-methyltransferase 1
MSQEPEPSVPMKGASSRAGMTVAGLFAGIGGIELGLEAAGHVTTMLCEIDRAALAVLSAKFPDTPVEKDIRELPNEMEWADIVAGGFPCQDLSQAGRTAGIRGEQSGLIGELFKRLNPSRPNPRWLVLENVSFMLHLDGGAGMRYLVDSLEGMGFAWAYRVIDTRAFGLPQRRRRVILVASRRDDPRDVLFADEAGEPERPYRPGVACGFYWTEGTRGLGWAVDAVPTLKGGSTIGIPSAPAIWLPTGQIVTPDIRDAERLQGFETDWTRPAVDAGVEKGQRWKLVGNAVSVPVFEWVGTRLARPGSYIRLVDDPMPRSGRWPNAAWGFKGATFRVDSSAYPVHAKYQPLTTFLKFEPFPLSAKATEGFLRRADASRLRFVDGFLDAVRDHHEQVRKLDRRATAQAG